MTLFINIVTHPVEFGISIVIAAIMVYLFLRAAMAPDRRPGWVRSVTHPNSKILFAVLFVGWAVVFGLGLQFVPHEGANSPYGGLGLIALFTGFFIMMGFLWAVIGE